MTSVANEQPIGSRSELIWVDSHCHLDMLKPPEHMADSTDQCQIVQEVLESAFEVGVGHFLCVSVDLKDYETMKKCVALDDRIAHSAGIHPSTDEPRKEQEWTDHLIELLEDESVVAVGETGLDFHYDTIDRSTQLSRFATQIALGRQHKLPLIVHSRQARQETLDLIRGEGGGDVAGVMHCFTESWEMAKAALDLGFYISFSGIVTFKNAQDLRDVAMKVPLDRLLIETDSPYLSPMPFRGRPNSPARVPWVGQALANLKKLDVEMLAKQTADNYFNLFSRAKRVVN